MVRGIRAGRVVLLALVVATCGDATGYLLREVETLRPDRTTLQLAEGDTATVSVEAVDRQGEAIEVVDGDSVDWAEPEGLLALAPAGDGRSVHVTALRSGETVLAAGLPPALTEIPVTVRPSPLAMAVVGPGARTGVVGEPLPEAIVLEVRDGRDRPMAGVGVTVDTVSFGGEVTTRSLVTDADGRVRFRWTLGTRVGEQWLDARPEGQSRARVRVTATAAAGPVAAVEAVGDSILLDAVGDTARAAFRAFDRFGNPTTAEAAWSVVDPAVATAPGGGPSLVAAGAGRSWARVSAGPAADSLVVRVAPVPTSLVVTPSEATLTAVGDSVRLVATARDRNGHPVSLPPESFTSSDSSIVQVGHGGWVVARAAGFARIEVRAGSLRRSVPITVAPAAGAVSVTPDAVTLDALGATADLTAAVTDANGHPVESPEVLWQSLDEAIAWVDAAGRVTARQAGAAHVVARAGDVADTVVVTVAQQPAAVRLSPTAIELAALDATATVHATVLDANGHPVAGVRAALRSVDPAVATVADGGSSGDATTGEVTATGDGGTWVVATAGAGGTLRDSIAVTVARVAASLELDAPAYAATAVGETVPVTATVRDANAHSIAVPVDSLSWLSRDTAVARPMAGGMTAVAVGTTRIGAAYQGLEAWADFTLRPQPAGVLLAPTDSVRLTALDETVTLRLDAVDADGAVLEPVQATWTSLDPAVASVDASGRVTARGNGTIRVEARSSLGSDTATVVVEQEPTRVVLEPATIEIRALGDTARFDRVTPLDANGHPTPDPVTWQVADPSTVTVAGDAFVSVGVGETAVAATTANGAGATGVVVSRQVPVTAAITPDSSSVGIGGETVLTAVARDANGVALLRPSLTWTSLDASVAGVDENGVVTGVAAGDARVVATLREACESCGAAVADTARIRVAAGLNLRIAALHVNQATQRLDGSVPLITGKPGLLRVFVLADSANAVRPDVRVRLYQDGLLLEEQLLPAAEAAVRQTLDAGTLAASWNLELPGALIRPGLGVSAEVDPLDRVAETDGADNRWPVGAPVQTLDVRTAPTLPIRLVPVHQAVMGATADVTPANRDLYLERVRAQFPLSDIDADIHGVYTTYVDLGSGSQAWSDLLREVEALRVAEGTGRYYYGLVEAGGSGIGGMGYVGGKSAVGIASLELGSWGYRPGAETLAHELGHNLGRWHAPGCGPASIDPSYPYADARIGQHGWDAETGTFHHGDETYDLMSYCYTSWISDYTYEAILAYRGTATTFATLSDGGHGGASGSDDTALRGGTDNGSATGQDSVLLVWGGIRADGLIEVEAPFALRTRPAPPRPGPFLVRGLDANGVELFRTRFAGREPGDGAPGERHFAFTVPMAPEMARLQRLEVVDTRTMRRGHRESTGAAGARRPGAADRGPQLMVQRDRAGRGKVAWDRRAYPAALVRDPVTGQVLGISRTGTAAVPAGTRAEVLLSDGIRTTRQVVEPRR